MFLGGVWHGANWTFAFWGLCHGIYLIINHLWRKLKINIPNLFSHILTLFCVVIAFAIFRAPNIAAALEVLKGLFGYNGIVLPESYEDKLAFLKGYGIVFKTYIFRTSILMIYFDCCRIVPSHFDIAQ